MQSLILVIVLAIIGVAMLDYAVMQIAWAPEGTTMEQIYLYWKWLWNFVMPLFSLAIALAYWTGASHTQQNRIITALLFITTLILTTISGLPDVFYFALGQRSFPAENTQWEWMFQYQVFGAWTTSMHMIWVGFWVGIVVPLMWFSASKIKVRGAIR